MLTTILTAAVIGTAPVPKPEENETVYPDAQYAVLHETNPEWTDTDDEDDVFHSHL